MSIRRDRSSRANPSRGRTGTTGRLYACRKRGLVRSRVAVGAGRELTMPMRLVASNAFLKSMRHWTCAFVSLKHQEFNRILAASEKLAIRSPQSKPNKRSYYATLTGSLSTYHTGCTLECGFRRSHYSTSRIRLGAFEEVVAWFLV